MNILHKLGLRRVQSDKTRSLLTILSVALSVALISVIVVSASVGYQLSMNAQKDSLPQYNVKFESAGTDTNTIIKSLDSVDFVSIETLEGYLDFGFEDFMIPLVGLDPVQDRKMMSKESRRISYEIDGGRLPVNEDEVLINNILLFDYELDIKLGDVIKVYNHQDKEDAIHTRDVLVVGFTSSMPELVISRSTDKPLSEKAAIRFEDTISRSDYKDQISIIKEHTRTSTNVKDDVVLEDSFLFYENSELNLVLGISGKPHPLMLAFASIKAFFLLIACSASIVIIYNAYNVSQEQRLYQSGIIRSVGTTRKQLKIITYTEGYVMGVLGLVLGLGLGILASYGLLQIVKNNFSKSTRLAYISWDFNFPFVFVLIISVITLTVVYIPLRKTVKRLFKLTSVDSLKKVGRFSSESDNTKRKLFSKSNNVTTRIAALNMNRDKKKYRGTIISIVISMIVMITTIAFMDATTNLIVAEFKEPLNYNIHLLSNDSLTQFDDTVNGLLKDRDDISNYITFSRSRIKVYDNNGEDYKTSDQITKSTSLYDGFPYAHEMIVLTDKMYSEYIKSIGYEYNADEVLVHNAYRGMIYTIDDKNVFYDDEVISIREGDQLQFGYHKEPSFKVGKLLSEVPFGIDNADTISVKYILSLSQLNNFKEHYDKNLEPVIDEQGEIVEEEFNLDYSVISLINSNDRVETVKYFNEQIESFEVYDIYANDELSYTFIESIYDVSLFLIGLIILMSLCNVVNITMTNASLRKQEFAIYASAGMTKKQLNTMLFKESILLMVKPLLIGTTLSYLCSYILFLLLGKEFSASGYQLNIKSFMLGWSLILVVIVLSSTLKIKSSKKITIIEDLKQIE